MRGTSEEGRVDRELLPSEYTLVATFYKAEKISTQSHERKKNKPIGREVAVEPNLEWPWISVKVSDCISPPDIDRRRCPASAGPDVNVCGEVARRLADVMGLVTC